MSQRLACSLDEGGASNRVAFVLACARFRFPFCMDGVIGLTLRVTRAARVTHPSLIDANAASRAPVGSAATGVIVRIGDPVRTTERSLSTIAPAGPTPPFRPLPDKKGSEQSDATHNGDHGQMDSNADCAMDWCDSLAKEQLHTHIKRDAAEQEKRQPRHDRKGSDQPLSRSGLFGRGLLCERQAGSRDNDWNPDQRKI